MLPLFDRGLLRVPVADTFPLDRAAEAYERFAAGAKLGKVVHRDLTALARRPRLALRRLAVKPVSSITR